MPILYHIQPTLYTSSMPVMPPSLRYRYHTAIFARARTMRILWIFHIRNGRYSAVETVNVPARSNGSPRTPAFQQPYRNPVHLNTRQPVASGSKARPDFSTKSEPAGPLLAPLSVTQLNPGAASDDCHSPMEPHMSASLLMGG